MNQSHGSSQKGRGSHGQTSRDKMKEEGGRSGGQHMPQGGRHSDTSRQQGSERSQRDMEREKAEKGKGGPA